MNTKYAIIVAGGSGLRMQSDLPKQFIELAGIPILMRTINTFYSFDNAINLVVVLPKSQIAFWDELCAKHSFSIQHKVVAGGETRFHSVKNGLSVISDDGIVAIHDGVRPLVSLATIQRCFREAAEFGNAIPCVPVYESVRIVNEATNSITDRSKLRIIQTPQVFSSKIIKDAYNKPFKPEFTDDASVLEQQGIAIRLVDGNRENIKITDNIDLMVARQFLEI